MKINKRALRYTFFIASFTLLIVLPAVFLSSINSDEHKNFINEDFYWAPCSDSKADLTGEENFQKIPSLEKGNLSRLADEGTFLWIKVDFSIPENLKNKDLGLVIPYLHFAEKGWINGYFAGIYGSYEDELKSAQYQSHFFILPEKALNQDGLNTFLMKVYIQGIATLSDGIYISDINNARKDSLILTNQNAEIYSVFVGGMFATFILFLTIFIFHHKSKECLHFALLNLFTIGFITPFFSHNMSTYISDAFSHLTFIKVCLCCCGYLSAYFTSSFLVSYYKKKQNVYIFRARTLLCFVTLIFIISASSYKNLMALTPFVITSMLIQIAPGIIFTVKQIWVPENRKTAIHLLLIFVPLLITIAIDVFEKFYLNSITTPWYTIFGWQISIIIFDVVLAYRYATIYTKYENLNISLEQEVEKQTANLTKLNEILAEEKQKAEIELELASIMQKKILPPQKTDFPGWDISILFEPLQKVSGDLYDYFMNSYGELTGLSIFDISGHGIAASLITMMSKNIIRKNFLIGNSNNESPSSILEKISNDIIAEKGDVDNYLTGILLSIDEFTKTEECTIHLANGGHPYPIVYRPATEKIEEIKPADKQNQFGAIGIKNFDVSFQTVNFIMSIDDVLVLYTDGLTESENQLKNQFGTIRLKDVISRNYSKTAEEIATAIRQELSDFMGEAKTNDDITIIVMKRINSSEYIQEL